MAKKGGLGRGLEAILGDVELAYKAELNEGKRYRLGLDRRKPVSAA